MDSFLWFYDIAKCFFLLCKKALSSLSFFFSFFPPNWMVESHASEYVGVFLFSFLDLLPAWFYTVDLLLNWPELHCAEELEFFSLN